jgi:hypothetical protein
LDFFDYFYLKGRCIHIELSSKWVKQSLLFFWSMIGYSASICLFYNLFLLTIMVNYSYTDLLYVVTKTSIIWSINVDLKKIYVNFKTYGVHWSRQNYLCVKINITTNQVTGKIKHCELECCSCNVLIVWKINTRHQYTLIYIHIHFFSYLL